MRIALLTAAGKGSRMQQNVPKQFLRVKNKPVILYMLEKVQSSPLIDEIVLVSLNDWKDVLWEFAKQYHISKLKYIVDGGKTGQESILCGLNAIQKYHDENDVIMIHDGNRPMISQEIIADSFATYEKYGSAVAAIPCVEAIFQSENGLDSEITYPREKLFRTQTPHTYCLKDLIDAHQMAKKLEIENTAATCVLMQKLGKKIYFSKGSEKNLKITTIDDVETFEAYVNNCKE